MSTLDRSSSDRVFKTRASLCSCAYGFCEERASEQYLIRSSDGGIAIPFCSEEHLARFALSKVLSDVTDEVAAAAMLERIARLASQLHAHFPADDPQGASASFADYLRINRGALIADNRVALDGIAEQATR